MKFKKKFVIILMISLLLFQGCNIDINNLDLDILQFEKSSSFAQLDLSSQQQNSQTQVSSQNIDDDFRYGFLSLSDNDKKIYDYITTQIYDLSEVISLENFTTSVDSIQKIIYYIRLDNPSIFWCPASYSYSTIGDDVTEVKFSYDVSKNKKEELSIALQTATDRLLDGIIPSSSDYEKVKIVHDNIITSSVYDITNNGQDIQNIMLENRGVCASYARTFQYLMHKVGVECLYVTGEFNSEAHAWNIVKIDDDFYHIDVTADDPTINMTFSDNDFLSEYVSYEYFNLTTAEIASSHTIDDKNYPLPNCTENEFNYFIKEDVFFNDYSDETNRNIIKEIKEAGEEKRISVAFKFSNKEAFEQIKKDISKSGISTEITEITENSKINFFGSYPILEFVLV